MGKKIKFFILAGIAFMFLITTVIVVNSQRQDTTQQDDFPTEVQENVKTPRERENGKRFRDLGDKEIDFLVSKQRDSQDLYIERGAGLFPIESNPFDFNNFISKQACDANAVIIGSLLNKTSQITDDNKFVFTDYEVKVDQVLKSNLSLPLVNSPIIVTRQGGKIRYKGKVITAIDKGFKPFSLGNHYLLFLKYIPESQSYLAYSEGSFRLIGNSVEQLEGGRRLINREANVNDFVNSVTNIVRNVRCSGGTVQD